MAKYHAFDEQSSEAHDDRVAEFLSLYSSHYSRLRFYITALLPTGSDAGDVLQETSLVLWRKFDSFELGTNFYSWACKVARFQVMKFRERQSRTARLLDTSLLETLAEEAIDESLSYGVSRSSLEHCLDKLSEADRTLIRRRYQPGASVQRLANDLGRSANSLSKSLGRIRRALLECLNRTLVQEVQE